LLKNIIMGANQRTYKKQGTNLSRETSVRTPLRENLRGDQDSTKKKGNEKKIVLHVGTGTGNTLKEMHHLKKTGKEGEVKNRSRIIA